MRLPWLLCCAAFVGALSCAQGSVAKFDDDDDGSGGQTGTSSTTTTTPTTTTLTTSTETTSTETTTGTTTTTTTTSTTTTTTTTSGSNGACYAGVEYCNPMQPAACGAGYACDVTCDEYQMYCWFDCFEPPNDQPIGSACDAAYGPWCVPSAFCYNYVCAKYCCTNTDCGGGTCASIGYFDTGTQQVDVMVCQ